MQTVNHKFKLAIVARVRARMSGVDRPEARCLHWAAATCDELRDVGIRAIVKAGSLRWPMRAAVDDDGIGATHFSSEWDAGAAAARTARGLLPEMHCWAAIPERGEIVDVTTGFLRAQQLNLQPDLQWTAADPPDFFWGTLPELTALSDGLGLPIQYAPDVAAIMTALQYLRGMQTAAISPAPDARRPTK